MFEPCYEHCWIRYNKSYSKECDDKCSYAKATLEKKLAEKRLDMIREFIEQTEAKYRDKMKNSHGFEIAIFQAMLQPCYEIHDFINKLAEEDYED